MKNITKAGITYSMIAILAWFSPTISDAQTLKMKYIIDKDGKVEVYEEEIDTSFIHKHMRELEIELDTLMLELDELKGLRIVEEADFFHHIPAFNGGAFHGSGAFLGIEFDETPKGLKLTKVIEKSAAELIGLEEGDILMELNGKKVDGTTIRKFIQEIGPGQYFEATVKQGRKKKRLKGIMGSRKALAEEDEIFNFKGAPHFMGLKDKPFPMRPKLGVFVQQIKDSGLEVTGIVPGSTAEKMGLQKGDVILKVNQQEVSEIDDLLEQIADTEGDEISVTYRRGDRVFEKEGELSMIHKPGMRFRMYPANESKNDIYIIIVKDEIEEFDQDDEVIIDELEDGSMEIFPNPNNGQFTLSVELEPQEEAHLKIMDASGKILLEKEIYGDGNRIEEKLDFSGEADGMLIIKLESEERIEIRKILTK